MQFISLWHSDHSVNVDSHWLDTEAGDQNIGSCFFFFNIYIILVSSDWNIVASLRSGLKSRLLCLFAVHRHAIYYLSEPQISQSYNGHSNQIMYMEEPCT